MKSVAGLKVGRLVGFVRADGLRRAVLKSAFEGRLV